MPAHTLCTFRRQSLHLVACISCASLLRYHSATNIASLLPVWNTLRPRFIHRPDFIWCSWGWPGICAFSRFNPWHFYNIWFSFFKGPSTHFFLCFSSCKLTEEDHAQYNLQFSMPVSWLRAVAYTTLKFDEEATRGTLGGKEKNHGALIEARI